ncbi:MAG: hypothetical protein M0R17_06935 [Candidatus Omnitrophica bacterium]|jgi:hypothetical protein|nr:hypothetical protein [Candidatus Omnitrophota bacterium]
MDSLITVINRTDLYGLQKVNIDQLVYCSNDNTIYHLIDISRKNKKDGWEQVSAVPTNATINIIGGAYLTQATADLRYVRYQTSSIHPDQTIYGNIHVIGSITASGEIAAFTGVIASSWWDSMPYATATTVGGIKVGSNLTIDANGVLNASGGAGATNWGLIGGTLADQTDLSVALGLKSDTSHTHALTSTTASGLTAGHFLKAINATTFGFAVHGLTYTDVGALSATGVAVDSSKLENHSASYFQVALVNPVTRTGTPVNDQIAVFTSASVIEGTNGITYDGTTLSITGNIIATGEISAFTGSAPTDWWDSMPLATTTTIGGLQLDGSIAHFFRGDGTWVSITSGTFDHSALSNLTYALSGHTGFLPDTHLTDFTHANIAHGETAYGWGNHASGGYASLVTPNFSTYLTINSTRAITYTHWGYSVVYPVLMLGASSGTQTISFGYDPIGNANDSFAGDGREILFRNGVQFVTPNAANDNFYLINLVLKDGNVGIGRIPATYKLEVDGDIMATGDVIAYA